MIFNLPSPACRSESFFEMVGHNYSNNLMVNFIRLYPILLLLTLMISISGCTRLGVESANQRTIDSFDKVSVTTVLNDLTQLDIDTYHAYMHAAKEIKTGKVHQLLKTFAADHEKHIVTLSKIVLGLGGHPPSFSRDFTGFLTTGYVAVKVAGGSKKTLEAMETNEIISNRYYNKALSIYMPGNIKEILRKHLFEEQHHLEIVQELQRQL